MATVASADQRQEDEARVITRLTAGEVDEATLEAWIRANVHAE